MLRKVSVLALLVVLGGLGALSQNNAPTNATPPQTASPSPAAGPATDSKPADAPAKASSDTSAPDSPKTPISSNKIPSGSKLFVAPMGGFENYVIAGIIKKKVPVVLVADRSKAEYEIRGSAETEKAGWAKMLFLGSQNSNEQASINVSEVKTGDIVFAYSVNKLNSVRGKQSAGEAIGKHLNEAIGKD